jgi:predicted ATPase
LLLSLDFNDWKSFGPHEPPPAVTRHRLQVAPLTLLVGPNASGKSNVLDALRFLQGVALDYPLADVLRGRYEGQREVWPAIRGGIVEAARAGTKLFALETSWCLDRRHLEHTIAVGTARDLAVEGEDLKEDGEYLFSTHAPTLGNTTGRQAGGAIRVALKGTGGGRNPAETYSSARSLLGQVEQKGRVMAAVVSGAHAVRDAMRGAIFLDIRPALMRDYRPENGGHLGTSGENISPALAALSEERRRDVVDWLAELCAPTIADIRFDKTRLREVMMSLVEGEREISARSLSDGTLRFLGHVVALITSEPGSLVVLEEPDVGLHPARIRLLAELLQQVTSAGGIQVLATTHSPTLLAHLSRESLGNVIAFGRERDTAYTVVSRLADLSYFETLATGDLEHLISTGWLERAL